MAPTRRARPRLAVKPPTPPESRPASAPRAVPGLGALEEDPHAHIVCRVCGRIQTLELTELDRHLLTELTALTPEGWTVERIAYSLAGSCRRCREGPPAP